MAPLIRCCDQVPARRFRHGGSGRSGECPSQRTIAHAEVSVLAIRLCYPKSTQLLKTKRDEPGWRGQPASIVARFYWAKRHRPQLAGMTSNALADRYGRKQMFIAEMVLFGIFNTILALSSSFVISVAALV